jgi:hypothetical protein
LLTRGYAEGLGRCAVAKKKDKKKKGKKKK